MFKEAFCQGFGIFTRIILALLFSLMIFFARSNVSVLIITIVALLMGIFFKTSLYDVVKSVFFMSLMYIIGGIPAVIFWGLSVRAVLGVVFFFTKTLNLMIYNKIFFSGVSPGDIDVLMRKFGKNLGFLHIDFFEISTVIMISLRFFNMVFEQAERSINALKYRGITFKTWNISKNFKVLLLLVNNVVNFALKETEGLAVGLEVRGYGYFDQAEEELELRFSCVEIFSLIMSILLFGVIIFCNRIKI